MGKRHSVIWVRLRDGSVQKYPFPGVRGCKEIIRYEGGFAIIGGRSTTETAIPACTIAEVKVCVVDNSTGTREEITHG